MILMHHRIHTSHAQAQKDELAKERLQSQAKSPENPLLPNPTSPTSPKPPQIPADADIALHGSEGSGADASLQRTAADEPLNDTLAYDQSQALSGQSLLPASATPDARGGGAAPEGGQSSVLLADGTQPQGTQEATARTLLMLQSNDSVEMLEGDRAWDSEGSQSRNVPVAVKSGKRRFLHF
jgi:hypothetical protein